MGNFFWKYHKVILLLFVIAIAAVSPFATRVKPDNSIEAISLRDDPVIKQVNDVSETFGSEEYITIAFEAPNIFHKKPLQVVQTITAFLEKHPYIDSVLSLDTIWRVETAKIDGETEIQMKPYLNPEWIQTGVPEAWQKKLLAIPIYRKLIYNPEGNATAVLGQLIPLGGDEAKRSQLIADVRKHLGELEKQTDISFHVFGLPVMNRTVYEIVEKEQETLTPLMLGAMFVILLLVYRNFFISLSSIILLGTCFAMVMGVLGLLGINLNWLTSTAPAVIMIVSICDAMHVISEFRAQVELSRLERAKAIFKNIGPPCLITSLTTAFGFLSLTAGRVKPLQEFGSYVTFGIVVALVFSFTLLVALLNYGPKSLQKQKKKESRFVTKFLDFAFQSITKSQSTIWIISFVVLFACLGGMGLLRADQKSIDIFKTDRHGLNAANAFIRRGVAGGLECQVYVAGTRPNQFLEPKHLREVETIEARAFEVDTIDMGISIVDLLKYLNFVIHDSNQDFYKIPDTRAEVSELMLILETYADDFRLRSLVNEDYSKTINRNYTRVNYSVEESMQNFDLAIDATQTVFKESEDSGVLKADIVGRSLIASHAIRYLPKAVQISLGLSLVLITVFLILLFRSIKVGLIAMIPNLLPIVVAAGLMGYLGVWVNIATSMVFAVALGIAVDDTVHLIWAVKREWEAGHDYEEAFRIAFQKVGRPIVISTLVLMGGFSMLSFSQLWPTTEFGLLVALSCLTALLADLFLTPVVFLRLKPFGKR